jgi:hypothetical protein
VLPNKLPIKSVGKLLADYGAAPPRYPRFRWIFPIFYAMTTVGFITLIVYRLVTGEAIK